MPPLLAAFRLDQKTVIAIDPFPAESNLGLENTAERPLRTLNPYPNIGL